MRMTDWAGTGNGKSEPFKSKCSTWIALLNAMKYQMRNQMRLFLGKIDMCTLKSMVPPGSCCHSKAAPLCVCCLHNSYRCVERILPIQSQMGKISLEDGRNNASSLDPQSTQVTQKLKDDFKERQQRQKNDVRC